MYLVKRSKTILKSHNQGVLLSDFVCPAKYRKKVFTAAIAATLQEVCVGISQRYEVCFIEIGCDADHVHILIQTVPRLSPKQSVHMVKSIPAREVLGNIPK